MQFSPPYLHILYLLVPFLPKSRMPPWPRHEQIESQSWNLKVHPGECHVQWTNQNTYRYDINITHVPEIFTYGITPNVVWLAHERVKPRHGTSRCSLCVCLMWLFQFWRKKRSNFPYKHKFWKSDVEVELFHNFLQACLGHKKTSLTKNYNFPTRGRLNMNF